jgi:protein-ribulosamine 3-kinase
MVSTQALAAALDTVLQIRIDANTIVPIHGGSISQAWRVSAASGPVFVKSGSREQGDMFAAEAAGLSALRAADAIRVPAVLGTAISGSCSLIAMEWLDLGVADERSDVVLGAQLAAQHRIIADRYGWNRDNTIGSTQQRNEWRERWIDFLREQRLVFQLRLAAATGGSGIDRLVDRGLLLCDHLHGLFNGYVPPASLLHGDLWPGNCGVSTGGEPVVFDPAVYFGDREADLAMTRLFGGFSPAFYSAYQSSWPMDPGATVRIELYNLYHVLNHFNLFGGDYAAQARVMIDRLLAHLGR